MDNKDLDLLRKCLPGKQHFKAAGKSDEDKEAFNECGDRLLWLRDNGFIEIGDKGVVYDRTPCPSMALEPPPESCHGSPSSDLDRSV
jgi:hypothetical protein